MKKLLTVLLTLCLTVTGLPYVAYAASSTPEISLEEFVEELNEIEEKYDDTESLFGVIQVTDGSEFYYIDGEDNLLTDDTGEVYNAVVTDNDLIIPFSAVMLHCEHSSNKELVNRKDLESLGFEIHFQDNTAIITKPLQTKRIIVKSKRAVDALDSVDSAEGYDSLHILQFDNEESTESALEYYNNLSYVAYAEPDSILSTQEIDYVTNANSSDGSMFYDNHLSWGSEYIGVDDYIDYLGNANELPEIVVGIIDTGVDIDHELLKDRIIETDVNYSSSGNADSEDDDNGHGSHVAGIVVDNTTDNVKIKGYKALNSSGAGSTSDICLAINKAVEDGVNVINMSLGGKGSDSYLTETVTSAIAKGVIVCVSAGNSGKDAQYYSPASIKGCITVAAMDYNEQIPYWSNWGDCVDIIAPGVQIYSSYKDGNYETLSGTSMACPFVAAAASLILSKYPTYHSKKILEVLQSNARDCSPPDELMGRKALYIGTVTEYNKDRTTMPEISLESGYYEESITVEITCADENAEIYYTTDGTRATQANGTLYTEPIIIDKVTSLHAVAYAPNKLKSLQNSAQYYLRYLDDEGNFEIDSGGTITAYNGNNNYLIVPDTVNGIAVTGIGSEVFCRSNIVMIEFPNTLTHIDNRSFYRCKNLTSVKGRGLVNIGTYALAECQSLVDFNVSQLEQVDTYGCRNIGVTEIYNEKLTEINLGAFMNCKKAISINLPNVTVVMPNGISFNYEAEEIIIPKVKSIAANGLGYCAKVQYLDFPDLTQLGESAFAGTFCLREISIPQYEGIIPRYLFMSSGIQYINNDNFTGVSANAFDGSEIETIVLREAKYLDEEAFYNCNKLKVAYLPSVETIESKSFMGCKNVTLLFLPSVITCNSLPPSDGYNTYFSEKLKECVESVSSLEYINNEWIRIYHQFNVIAPSDSFAEEWAKENGYTFTDSYSMTTAYGGQIRLYDTGLRFGFSWKEIDELNRYADNIEYGFEYAYGETDKLTKPKKAVNYIYHEETDNTTFNLVFTNVPKSAFDTTISARAYVNIDGMIFKSPILQRSFAGVADSALNDNTIDDKTKLAIKKLLEA